MIKLTETIVKRPIAAIMIMSAIIVFGAMALISMPQELTPDMEMPMLVISTVYPRAGAKDVETQVSKLIEDAVGTLSGVRTVTSQSRENISLTIIQYEYGIDLKRAYTDARERIDGIVNNLPDEAHKPVVMEINMNSMPSITLSVTSEVNENLLQFVEREIVPEFEKLSSVSSVSVSGGQEEYVRVELKEEMMREYELSINSVVSALAGTNYSAPLGSAEFGDFELAVRIETKHETIDSLNNIPLTLRGGGTIRLSDIADIYITTADAQSISRYNGSENITINIQKPQNVSADRVSAHVMREIGLITATNPDLTFIVINDDSVQISSSINSVAQTLVLAILISMLVLFLFLGDIRACLIVGSSMPISLLATFVMMDLMGYTLNIVSMSGLVIGVGMMVDNSIVVIDSCFKSRTGEKTFKEAAIEGTKFVMLSIFAVTLTTVAVFLPMATIQGIAGQMFAPLGFSIIFALTASLFSAMTLVPLFFVQFKPVERKKSIALKFFKKIENGYAKLLSKVLKKKKTVLAVTLAFMALSVYLVSFLNFEMMPFTDDGVIRISLETRPGLKLERVNDILTELEKMVATHPDVERYSLTAGGSGGIYGGGGTTLIAYLHKDRSMQTSEVIEQWRLETRFMLDADINISPASQMNMAGSADGSFEMVLRGDSLDRIKEAVILVEEVMNEHPDIIRVSSGIDKTNPQAEIVIDTLRAASLNVSPQMITGAVFTALNGSSASDIRIDDRSYSIRVEYPRGRYESLSDVADMMIVSATGALVPLSEVSAIVFSDTPQTITREQGWYIVNITGVPAEAARFTAQREVEELLRDVTLPYGVSFTQSASDQMMREELSSLGMAIFAAVLLVFMVLAIQFESIRHSLMVMTCIPFAAIGSFFLMYITGTTISMVSLLGFLVLIGLIVNNGILFVDTTNKYRKTMELHEALIHTGRTRLRPILMITLTSVFAMLPLAMGLGDGAELMQGLGITVIGGLTASTVLALLLLPTFYLLIDGNPEKRAQRKKRRTEKREAKVLEHKTENEDFNNEPEQERDKTPALTGHANNL
ncbi:MAG: efflux RND transporter permease subunit [Oscillospiraceae bacterium]|nr:efflux RND transporter permease subunit [Oscillospiraceae bacterium]